MPRLTTDHAKQIAVKRGLDCEVDTGRANHTSVAIRWRGRTVAIYFISRSSRPTGAKYLKDQLYLSERETLDLARCVLTADGYYDILCRLNKLPSDN